MSQAGAAQPAQGMLEIQIKDHRDAIGDFSQLKIVVDKFSLSPAAGLKFWRVGWYDLTPTFDSVDLTQYIGKKSARIYRGALDVGRFDAFHLKIKTIEGVLKKNRRAAPVKNSLAPVMLGFEVRSQTETLMIIDLAVTDFSDHPPRGYELGLRGYELYTAGKLIAKVPPG
jgi:hypothetical protein